MNYSYKIQDKLFESLCFLVEAAKLEPGLKIYKAHIKQADTVIAAAADKNHKFKQL